MMKSISSLTLSVLLFVFVAQSSHADEFDNLARAQAEAEQQRRDQEQYRSDLAEIAAGNRKFLSNLHSFANLKGGKARNLRCYEGLEYPGLRRTVGPESDYTWQMVNGVPVGTAIPHYTAGNAIGAIAMSPFTIGNALHNSGQPEEVHHNYPPSIGLCHFMVNKLHCSVSRYYEDDESRGISAQCL